MSDQEPQSAVPAQSFDLKASIYANNTRFEPSLWNLRMLFGELEQHTGKEVIDWHTALTMPWMQAKVFAYYLQLNIYLHELTYGRIPQHPNITPPPLIPPTEEAIKENPGASKLQEFAARLHQEIFGS